MVRLNGALKFIGLSLMLWVVTSTALYADTYYVGDTLRVGIRPEPINGGPSLAVVSSGTPLEVIERKGRHVKVRSPGGVEGWVKGAYLTRSKPAQLLLDEATKKANRLENEIKRLRAQGGGSSTGNSSIDIAKLEAEKSALQQEVEQLRESLNNNGSEMDAGSSSLLNFSETNLTPLYFLIGGLVFILSLGFLFGVTWHKHQVTKRLGGLSL